jgi:hypothetical protein
VFVSRARRGTDRWLSLKLAAFGIGAALALAGIALRSDLLVTLAIITLALGLLLRLLSRRDPPGD